MARHLSTQRLTPYISRLFQSRSYTPFKNSSTHRAFASASQLHEAPKPEEPKVVYTRPTTLSGGDRNSSPLRVWPFVLILAGGFYGFNVLIKERSGTAPPEKNSVVKTEHPRG